MDRIFYTFAALRGVNSAEKWLAVMLLIMARVNSQTTDLATFGAPQWWPLLFLGAVELVLGFIRKDSFPIFAGLCSAIAAFHFEMSSSLWISIFTRTGIELALLTIAILLVGAIYRDDFAWLLRLAGAPLLVIATIAGCVVIDRR